MLCPMIPVMCGGSTSLVWHIISVAQRKKVTTLIPVYHKIREVIDYAFQPWAEEIQEEMETMDIVVAILGKALFASKGEHVRVLLEVLHGIWPTMCRLFHQIFMDTPTMRDIPAFFEFFLVHQPRAHRSVGLNLESHHQLIKDGVSPGGISCS